MTIAHTIKGGKTARYIGQAYETNPYVENSQRRAIWSRAWVEQDADPDQISAFNRAGYAVAKATGAQS